MSALTLSQPLDYHWSGPNQRRFLEALAQNGVVSLAARLVNMSAQAAYVFRQRAAGRVFALGWLAAILVSRDRLFDDLMERAFLGQEEELVRHPESNRLVRRRIDNRLGMGLLSRLDRMIADAAEREPLLPAARIVAGDFERYLDLVEQDASAADVRLFLASSAGDATCAFHYQLAQKSAGFEEEEAALEGSAESDPRADDSPEAYAACLSVWYDGEDEEWRTNFPPPPGYDGVEFGSYGDADYERTLTEAEAEVQDARKAVEDRPYVAAAHKARDAWFRPEAAVRAEMAQKAAAQKAAAQAERKAAEQARRAADKAARMAGKNRAGEGEGAVKAEREGNAPLPPLADELDWETKAAMVADGLLSGASEPAPILPSAPGNRIITMPQQPRGRFGVFGDTMPCRGGMW